MKASEFWRGGMGALLLMASIPTAAQEAVPESFEQVEERRLALLSQRRELDAEIVYMKGIAELEEAFEAITAPWPLLAPFVRDASVAAALEGAWEEDLRRQAERLTRPAPQPTSTNSPTPPITAARFALQANHVAILGCGSTISGPFAMIRTGRDPAKTLFLNEAYEESGAVWRLNRVVRISEDTIRADFSERTGDTLSITREVGTGLTPNCEAD